jgi:hypothetical protein
MPESHAPCGWETGTLAPTAHVLSHCALPWPLNSDRNRMSAVALPSGGAVGWPGHATPDVSGFYSRSDLAAGRVKPRREDFPRVDARIVRMVLSGEFPVRERLGSFAVESEGPETSGEEAPCPVGTRPCPEDCTSINVWGLSQMTTEEDLLCLCRKFGVVSGLEISTPKSGGDEAWALVGFRDRRAAQLAQATLHRTEIHGKVCCKQGVALCKPLT